MNRIWRIHPHQPDRIAQLQRAVGVPAVVAQLLICRGLDTPDVAREFLSPKLTDLIDPDLLPGIPEATERLAAAVADRRRIVVYGDYDVDGMSATALLFNCLKLLGADVSYYVPHRLEEGYGLNPEALTTLAAQGAQSVVTVDCGISAVAEARLARELGLELIVTDHHAFAPELPEAAAIVHPQLPGHAYPFTGLSGSGVALKLAWALCRRTSQAKRVGPRMKEFLLQAVALAALGTVADVVPLLGENRVLVRHGLAALKERPTLGLATLLSVTGLDQKRQFDSEDIGFTIAPRLNAAGRLGQAQLAVELLVTDSPQRAQALAEYVHELNSSRQSLERSILLAANKQAQQHLDTHGDAALVLAERGWHPGVIGIVASKLVERYYCPVVLIALDELDVKPGVGSGRSISGFDLHRALAACQERLLSFGGHAAAAGLKIAPEAIDAFRAEFCEFVATERNGSERRGELWIDAEAPLSAFNMQAVDQLNLLAPFGPGNRPPMWCASGVTVEAPQRMGGGGRHLSLHLRQGPVRMRAVAFGAGDRADELAALEGPLEVAFRPVINQFRGRRTVELHLADWRASAEATTSDPRAAVRSA